MATPQSFVYWQRTAEAHIFPDRKMGGKIQRCVAAICCERVSHGLSAAVWPALAAFHGKTYLGPNHPSGRLWDEDD